MFPQRCEPDAAPGKVAFAGCIAGLGNPLPLDRDMSQKIGFQLALYSLLLAGGSYFVHQLAPAQAQAAFVTGLAGGALCLVWAILALAGSRGKALPILTLAPVCFVLLSQAVMGWSSGNQGAPASTAVAALNTGLLVLSLGMLMRIAYAGAVFDEKPPKPGAPAGAATDESRKPAPPHPARHS
jgi:hypothetical protein